MGNHHTRILVRADLDAVLAAITFGPSGARLAEVDLQWEVENVIFPDRAEDKPGTGWLIRFTFSRPDAVTGETGRGAGRWELVERGASESSVVKTCWLLLDKLVWHELAESFRYRGAKLFDPHKDVDTLAFPGRLEPLR